MPRQPLPLPTEKWAKSKAKADLLVAILTKQVTADTNLKQLHESCDEYFQWPWAQFSTNTKNFIKSCNDPNKRPKVKWSTSEAKDLLHDDILRGTVTEDSDPNDVFKSRIEYQMFPYENFKSNLESLLDTILKDFERLQTDLAAYAHDIAIIAKIRQDNPHLPIPWHRSEAKPLLEQDIDEEKHLALDKHGRQED